MGSFNLPLFLILLVVFCGIMFYLARMGNKRTSSLKDYATAGGQMNPWVTALSYVAAFISTSAIVGFGGAGAVNGIGVSWLSFLHTFFGIFIAFAFIGNRVRKMCLNTNSNTMAELLGNRYQSKGITSLIGLMIFIFMPAYTAICLIGGARFLEQAMNMNFVLGILIIGIIVGVYVGFGGLKGMMYCDAFMGVLMAAGMIVLLIVTYYLIGGVTQGHQTLTDMRDLVPLELVERGHQGWTAMPKGNSPIFWNILSTLVMGVGLGVLAQPQLILRFLTLDSKKALNRSIGVGGVALFCITGVAFLMGPLTNVLFYQRYGKLAMEMAGGNADSIIPIYISEIMPQWYVYVYMFILLAATISTVSSLIHVSSMGFASDLFAAFPKVKGAGSKKFIRIGLWVGVAMTIILAIVLPTNVIAKSTAFWYGLCAAGTLPALIAGIYWKKAGKAAGVASIISGYAVTIFGYLFINTSISKPIGLCRLLFGVDSIAPYPLTDIEPLLYGVAVSTIVLIVVALATRNRVDDKYIAMCFDGIGKKKKKQAEAVPAVSPEVG